MKKAICFLFVLVILALQCGCGKTTDEPEKKLTQATQFGTESTVKSENNEIKAIAQDRVESHINKALDIMKERKNGSEKTYSFVQEKEYDSLTDNQKKLYNEVLPKVLAYESFVYTAEEYGYDTLDDLLMVMGAIHNDHPLTAVYFTIEDVLDGDMTTALKSKFFNPKDEKTNLDEIKREVKIFDEQCDIIVNRMPEGLSAYDQYRYLALVISSIARYDNDNEGLTYVGNIYGPIQGGLAICEGYARGFMYLCQKADLYCEIVDGSAGEESHAWNLVKLEQGTYHIDVTWCDSDTVALGDYKWFDYFMLRQQEITLDHIISDGTVATGEKYLTFYE